jgi:hypothetical protein
LEAQEKAQQANAAFGAGMRSMTTKMMFHKKGGGGDGSGGGGGGGGNGGGSNGGACARVSITDLRVHTALPQFRIAFDAFFGAYGTPPADIAVEYDDDGRMLLFIRMHHPLVRSATVASQVISCCFYRRFLLWLRCVAQRHVTPFCVAPECEHNYYNPFSIQHYRRMHSGRASSASGRFWQPPPALDAL